MPTTSPGMSRRSCGAPRGRTRSAAARCSSASTLLGPATFVVALGLLLPILILFRYSFNKFEPRVMMVEAVTLENYVKFFTDPFYTNIFWTTLRVALLCTVVCLVLAFPLAYVLARTREPLQERPADAGGAAAVRRQRRARRRLDDAVRLQGRAQRGLDEARRDRRAAADHVHREGGDHRHHRRQPALHGADAAERARGHRPQPRGGGLQPRRRAVDHVPARAVAAGAARHHRRRDPVLHPRP